MGSATVLDMNNPWDTNKPSSPPKAAPRNRHFNSGMKGRSKGKSSTKSIYLSKGEGSNDANSTVGKKRPAKGSDKNIGSEASQKRPKRANACSNFKEKTIRLSGKRDVIEARKERLEEDEMVAVKMTLTGSDDLKPTRKLLDFVIHDEDGIAQPFEMSEVQDLYISGLIMPNNEETKRENGIRCKGFGRIESWAISGYEEGSAVVWVSTDVADYDCAKPANSYKKFFDHFYDKAQICVEVFKKVSRSYGGNPDVSLDELLAGIVRSMSSSRTFNGSSPTKDFVISLGDFIYNQLTGLDESSKKNDEIFSGLPVLVALCNKSKKRRGVVSMPPPKPGAIKIKDGANQSETSSSASASHIDDGMKVAQLLQEEEYWKAMKKKGARKAVASPAYYIKIKEDEIASDYPLPAFYKTSVQEMDEYAFFDDEIDLCNPDNLPRRMLHNWALYNTDLRLIPLELLPMKPCAEVDLTIFGSGAMTEDDGSGFCLDTDPVQSCVTSSASKSGADDSEGIPIYLSAIKEWMIEFGASMVFISIRTDVAWYRLGKPSKQYAPWHKPVLKTATLAISIITLLKEQNRVSRLSFADVVKKVSEFGKDHPAYISSHPASVERYVAVHGQIILQQFAEFPDKTIRRSAFVSGLSALMEQRHHTKLVMKKKAIVKKESNLNPRAAIGPETSKRMTMRATTTRLINRIWGEYYSNYLPEDPKEASKSKVENEIEEEEQEENGEDDEDDEDAEKMEEQAVLFPERIPEPSRSKPRKSKSPSKQVKWTGKPTGKLDSGESLYKSAYVRGDVVAVAGAVMVDFDGSKEILAIIFVEYMYEKSDGRKMVHGRVLQRGSQTILGNAANPREVFLTNDCLECELGDVKETVVVEIRFLSWGHQFRKENAATDKIDSARAEERQKKGLPLEYYCKSLYSPETGAFLSLPFDTLGLGNGSCQSCKIREIQEEFKVNHDKSSFMYKKTEYFVHDFIYLNPEQFSVGMEDDRGTFKAGRNVGLKAFVVCQLLEIESSKSSKQANMKSTKLKVRRFYRPEDIESDKAYAADIREIYYSKEIHSVPVESIEGKCEVKKQIDLPSTSGLVFFDHVFFCECIYEAVKGTIKQLPSNVRLQYSRGKVAGQSVSRNNKGKGKCRGNEAFPQEEEPAPDECLKTLDIFAGCGGLSEGLQQAGAAITKWAIEYDEAAAEAFSLNHPEAYLFVENCNVVLRAIMEKCGDLDDCISTTEAAELAEKLGESKKNNLPLPGQVDFINGGPPCQGFSGMNRFSHCTWSKVQCEMILAFLSFADYFRPRFFLLENVRNFVSFNKGQTFRLTLASLLEIGYQVRFGILEAGNYGVSQSRKRAFIWAAAPEETLPEWPEPMHVFGSPLLKITLPGDTQYAAVRSTAGGAPFRSITVRDTIGDLPSVLNGANETNMANWVNSDIIEKSRYIFNGSEIDLIRVTGIQQALARKGNKYKQQPVSWFQKQIRGSINVLSDHISKEMNELNLIRCQRIPKRPGADWHDLPDEKVKLSTGQMVDLIPWCLPNTAKRHNQWKGLFGRLDWEGNFPTSITDPQPMGKVGMCFHPEQDRIITVRECARSQGFPDSYCFCGNIQSKHRQIGNAVPPPLAKALGMKLKEVLDAKHPST